MIKKLTKYVAALCVLISISGPTSATEASSEHMILGKGTNLAHWLSQTTTP